MASGRIREDFLEEVSCVARVKQLFLDRSVRPGKREKPQRKSRAATEPDVHSSFRVLKSRQNRRIFREPPTYSVLDDSQPLPPAK